MPTEKRNAEEVQLGDSVHFPNSRHAQPVTFAGRKNDGDQELVLLETEGAQWTVPHGFRVNVEVPEPEESE